MSHLHIPDGILSPVWWVPGYILTAIILVILVKTTKKEDLQRKMPLAGVGAALMLLGMSVPLGIVPLHLSLAVMIGLIVGPTLGFLVVFVVNIILALFGHGGITVVGLNTLVIGSEVLIGYFLFSQLRQRLSLGKSAGVAAVIAILISLSMMVAIVGINVGLPEALPHDHDHHHGHDHDHDHHDDDEDHHHDDEDHHHDEDDDHHHDDDEDHHHDDDEGHHHDDDEDHHHDDDEDHHHDDDEDHHHDDDEDHHHDDDEDHHHGHSHDHDHDHDSFIDAVRDVDYFFLTGWIALIAIFAVGLTLEVSVTVLMVNFISRIKPDLLK